MDADAFVHGCWCNSTGNRKSRLDAGKNQQDPGQKHDKKYGTHNALAVVRLGIKTSQSTPTTVETNLPCCSMDGRSGDLSSGMHHTQHGMRGTSSMSWLLCWHTVLGSVIDEQAKSIVAFPHTLCKDSKVRDQSGMIWRVFLGRLLPRGYPSSPHYVEHFVRSYLLPLSSGLIKIEYSRRMNKKVPAEMDP